MGVGQNEKKGSTCTKFEGKLKKKKFFPPARLNLNFS